MSGATFEECLDELIALASNAGHLGNEAITANTRAYASRDPRLKRQASKARKQANEAEQMLAGARRRFLERFDTMRAALAYLEQDEYNMSDKKGNR